MGAEKRGEKNREIKSLPKPMGLNAHCMIQLITITVDQSNLQGKLRGSIRVKQQPGRGFGEETHQLTQRGRALHSM